VCVCVCVCVSVCVRVCICVRGGGRPIAKPTRVCVQKAVLRDHMYERLD